MPNRQKYGVITLLGVGYIVTVLSNILHVESLYNTDWDQTWMRYPAFLATNSSSAKSNNAASAENEKQWTIEMRESFELNETGADYGRGPFSEP
jgi:hypothetical protein